MDKRINEVIKINDTKLLINFYNESFLFNF